MKQAPVFVVLLALAAFTSARAQEKPAKTERKTLTFQPGAKTPDQAAEPAPAPVAAPSAAEKPALVPVEVVPKTPAEIAKAFFFKLGQGDIDAAYLALTKGSKIAERPEELRALKTKTREAIDVFGSVKGYDLVENKLVGERLVRATYISLGQEFPLRWRFYFYKADDVWRLIDLRVDDKLAGIFEEPEEVKPADKP